MHPKNLFGQIGIHCTEVDKSPAVSVCATALTCLHVFTVYVLHCTYQIVTPLYAEVKDLIVEVDRKQERWAH